MAASRDLARIGSDLASKDHRDEKNEARQDKRRVGEEVTNHCGV